MNIPIKLWLLFASIWITPLLWSQDGAMGPDSLNTHGDQKNITQQKIRNLVLEQNLLQLLNQADLETLGIENTKNSKPSPLTSWADNVQINRGLASHFAKNGYQFIRFSTMSFANEVIPATVVSPDAMLRVTVDQAAIDEIRLAQIDQDAEKASLSELLHGDIAGVMFKVEIIDSLDPDQSISLFVQDHQRLETNAAIQGLSLHAKGVIGIDPSEALIAFSDTDNKISLGLKTASAEATLKVSIAGIYLRYETSEEKGAGESSSQIVNGGFSSGGNFWTWFWRQQNSSFTSARIDNNQGNGIPSAVLGGGNAFGGSFGVPCTDGTIFYSSFQQTVALQSDVEIFWDRKYAHVDTNLGSGLEKMNVRIVLDDLTTFENNVLVFNADYTSDLNWNTISREIRGRAGHLVNIRFEGRLVGVFQCNPPFTGDYGHKMFIDNVSLNQIPSLKIPLYRLFKWDANVPGYRDHLYTISTSERNSLIGAGWTDEGIAGYVSQTNTGGLLPLYRLYVNNTSVQKRDHFYTTKVSDRDLAISLGYVYEGIEGYVSASHITGTNPFYRLFSAAIHDHFYSASVADRNTAISIGFVDEGNEGYIWANP